MLIRPGKELRLSDPTSKYKIWEPLALSLAVIIGMFAGGKLVQHNNRPAPKETTITNTRYSGRQVEEIIRFLETKYVGDVNADSLVQNAIEAIMQGLDPHTHYFPPDQMEELEERTMGHYVGVGIEIAFINDSLVILYPKHDSPAERAGVKPGDYIIAVDDIPVPHDTLDRMETPDLIKGNKGSKVKLTLKPMLSDSIPRHMACFFLASSSSPA